MAELRQNTWTLGEWYDQDYAGNAGYYGAGEIWAWGRNGRGQLGQGVRSFPGNNGLSSPVQVIGTGWRSLTPRAFGGIATKTDGALWSWGYNARGQQGQNDSGNNYSSPIQVGSGTDWSTVHAGYYSTLATKTNGQLWVWGANFSAQLGLNDRVDYSSPVQIPGTTWPISGEKKIAQGASNGFAIKTDGTLWTWGSGQLGRSGQNNLTQYSSPVQIGSGTDWSQISSFEISSFAVKTNGTLWSWAYNGSGQLGVNDRTNRSSPTQIPGTNWKSVSAAYFSASGTKTDGTLWAWGNNNYGQLGQNSLIKRSSPTQIPGTNWNKTYISKRENMMASKTDGTLWVLGRNQLQGPLGQNNRTDYSSPVQIDGTDWSSQHGGMGYFSAMVLKEME